MATPPLSSEEFDAYAHTVSFSPTRLALLVLFRSAAFMLAWYHLALQPRWFCAATVALDLVISIRAYSIGIKRGRAEEALEAAYNG